VGALIALTTFVLSGATFITTSALRYWRESHAVDRLLIVDIDTTSAVLLSNSGDNDAFVTDLEVRCPELHWDEQYPLNKAVKAGEVLSINIQGPKGSVLGGLEASAWNQVVDHLKREGNVKLVPAFFSADNPVLNRLEERNHPLNSLPGVAVLHFVSAKNGAKLVTTPINLVTVLVGPEKDQSNQQETAPAKPNPAAGVDRGTRPKRTDR
jgi:hypothetical protein